MAPGMIPVISIVGRSKSGKTTLIEKLVKELSGLGYRVATVKHDVHGFDIDIPGKDSWRHAQAGANPVVISSPDKIAFIKKVQEEIPLDEIVQRYLHGVDIVITEGFKRENKPKIEVYSPDEELICSPSELLAVVSESPLALNVPRFDRHDAPGIARFLEENFLKR